MTTTDHAIVAPAVPGDPGTRADAGGFDPALPFRTRDGREVKGFGRAFGGGYFGKVKLVPHCRWRPDGTCVYQDEDLDLVNYDTAAPDPIPEPNGDAPPALTFTYRNYRGAIAERHVRPLAVRFGNTDWHPEPQWLLRAFDLDKMAEREFAMKDIGVATPAPASRDPVSPISEGGDASSKSTGPHSTDPCHQAPAPAQSAGAAAPQPGTVIVELADFGDNHFIAVRAAEPAFCLAGPTREDVEAQAQRAVAAWVKHLDRNTAADGYAHPEALHAFASFVWRQGDEIDAAAVQDEAERRGLLESFPYDPEKHGESDAEPGEEIFRLKPLAGGGGAASDGEDDVAFVSNMDAWTRNQPDDALPAESKELARLISLARRGARPHVPTPPSPDKPGDAPSYISDLDLETWYQWAGYAGNRSIRVICRELMALRAARGEVSEAVLGEREACAKIAAVGPWLAETGELPAQFQIAAAIRARPTPAAVLDRARPAGQGEGDGWLPITTAPKDGYIIGARHDGREYRDVGKYAFETRFGRDEWLEDEHGRSVALTHWLPSRAAPPSAAAATSTPLSREDDAAFVRRMDRTMRPDRLPEEDARLRELASHAASRATSAPAQDAGPAGVTEEEVEAAYQSWLNERHGLDRREAWRKILDAAARARTLDAGKEPPSCRG